MTSRATIVWTAVADPPAWPPRPDTAVAAPAEITQRADPAAACSAGGAGPGAAVDGRRTVNEPAWPRAAARPNSADDVSNPTFADGRGAAGHRIRTQRRPSRAAVRRTRQASSLASTAVATGGAHRRDAPAAHRGPDCPATEPSTPTLVTCPGQGREGLARPHCAHAEGVSHAHLHSRT
jgi:hypothetical protein